MEVLVLGNEVLLEHGGNRGAPECCREELEEKRERQGQSALTQAPEICAQFFFQERRQVEAAAMQDSEWGESLPFPNSCLLFPPCLTLFT